MHILLFVFVKYSIARLLVDDREIQNSEASFGPPLETMYGYLISTAKVFDSPTACNIQSNSSILFKVMNISSSITVDVIVNNIVKDTIIMDPNGYDFKIGFQNGCLVHQRINGG